jgi:CheY-like chemotaxis protein
LITAQNEALADLPISTKRVLVAEDSPVTQDLLKLILMQRGHKVDIAHDGEQALAALDRTPYDVALIDFRLPKLDGLSVAQQYRSHKNGDSRARLIAITADVEGLLAHKENCENFDQIIPKPLDIYEVCKVIETSTAPGDGNGRLAGDVEGLGGIETGLTGVAARPVGAFQGARRPEPPWATGLELLRWPDDIPISGTPGAAVPEFQNLDSIDAILIKTPASVADLSELWSRRPLHLFPVIDLDGSLRGYSDYDASKGGAADGDAVRRLIQGFHQRRTQLHRDLITTSDAGEILLGRMFVKDAPLSATYDPNERSLVHYNATLPSDDVIPAAERQCKNGFLQKEFFDRFHTCYRCSSSRLHIREECATCNSAQLREEAYIHHFRCGFQGVDTDFRHGDTLTCPKCRQELLHFSVDYDKPGTLLVCGQCGHAESEPTVGFLCMDCNAHCATDRAATIDIYSYKLTQEGIAFLKMGNALRGAGQRGIRFSDLPLDFVVALNTAAKKFNELQTPFTVVNLAYEHEREITREAGLRQFRQARDQFLENLTSLLRDKGVVVKGHSYDFCLLNAVRPDEAESIISEAAQDAATSLSVDLGMRFHLFGHEDFA